MILSCQGVSKAFGEKVILDDASFHIEEREKAALIGNNGAGKTTLLRIIMGEIPSDSGTVTLAKDSRIGYLAQYQDIQGDLTIYEELLTTKQYILDMENRMRAIEKEMKHADGEELDHLMNAYTRLTHEFELENGYAYKSELTGVLKGLGFSEEDFSQKVGILSGGQKTRVALGKLLLSRPDILLLDEPTNHLDMESIAWLENYLLNYPGAVFIVSHDRYFLDKVVTKVVEIEAGHVTCFPGNYSSFAEKKARLRDALYKAYLNQQREIKHQEAVIVKLKSFNREKSIRRAESREKMLNKMQRIEKPVEIQTQMRLSLEPRTVSGNDVLTVENLAKSFPGQPLFSNVSFQIKRGERIALIGNNGTGKTTMLKILNGLLDPDEGRYTLGTKVQIGYYDQEHHVLHSDKTIFQEISDAYPTLTETEIRNMLAAFLFTGEDVFKEISSLSGGGKGPGIPCQADALRGKLPDPGRAHQPPGHCLQGDPGGSAEQLYRNRTLRLPRPLLYQPDGHKDPGSHQPGGGKLYRGLRLLSGEKRRTDRKVRPCTGRHKRNAFRRRCFREQAHLAAAERRTGAETEKRKRTEKDRTAYRGTGDKRPGDRRHPRSSGGLHRSRTLRRTEPRKRRHPERTGGTV